jgi:hypothetical protein
MTQQRYIVIQEWMQELDLNASELLAFALIWGFSQDGESDFHGSVSYVAGWCKVKERQANEILRKLTEKGYITKQENPGHPNHYTVTPAKIADLQKLHTTPAIIAYPTPAIIADDNKVVDNKRDNKDIQSLPRTREDLNAYGEFVRMSAENYARLVTRFGADDAARLCEILDAYLAKKPNAYRDHYRAALGWPVQRLQEEKLNQQRLKNAQEAGQRAASPQQQQYSGYGAAGLEANRRLAELLKQN